MTFLKRLRKPWFKHNPFLLNRHILFNLGFLPKGWVKATTCFGSQILVDNTKAIGRTIYKNGVYELFTSELIWRLLTPGSVFIDVGANIGYYSLLAAARLSNHGTVLAFEPRPDIFSVLAENCRPYSIIEPFQMGVSSKEGWAQLSIPKESNVNEGIASLEKMDNPALTYSVQTVTLSKFLESSATLIKIDVEGHEFDVLMGAEQLFKQKAVSHIIFEDHDIHNSKIPAFLEKIGYCIFSIGWDMNGVILKPLSSSNTFLINDAPNFIATLEPESVHRIVEKSGWTVLSGLAEERVA